MRSPMGGLMAFLLNHRIESPILSTNVKSDTYFKKNVDFLKQKAQFECLYSLY